MKKNVILALLVIVGLVTGCASSAIQDTDSNLNSAGRELEITFSADGKTAVFSSNREGGYGSIDIYTSQFDGKKWGTPVNIGPAINTPARELEASLSDDGQILYFTRKNVSSTPPHGELYISRKVNGEWQLAENWNDVPELPHVNSPDREAHCPIIVSKDLIYFSYDVPEVTQGSDLYQIRRVNGVWQEPEPFPGEINSPYRDHPHWTGLSQDGNSLIFVSNRPDGQGGDDQWISRRDSSGNWSAPENLGPLFNTAGSEICWAFTPDGEYFVGAADWPGGKGDLDIHWLKPSSIPLLKDFKPRTEPPINLLK